MCITSFQVRVEDEILHRRASESSTDDKVRRRRRKRRPKRGGSEGETDSDRQTRRRRRRKKDHVDTSDDESEVESHRRRRKSKKDKFSEESESEETTKRKRKSSKSRRKRSVSNDRLKEEIKKEKTHKKDSDNEEIQSNSEDQNENSEQHLESRRLLKEEITTKEVIKSKKVIEHKAKSSSKPTVTKTSKTTCEETKTEEQITKKTSEVISAPPENKGDDISTQESHDTPVQQVVTAIVHQEESAEQQNEESENILKEYVAQRLCEDGILSTEITDDKKEQVTDKNNTNTENVKEEESKDSVNQTDSGELQEGKRSTEENIEIKKDEKVDLTADDRDFWDGGEEDNQALDSKDENIQEKELKIEELKNEDECFDKEHTEEIELNENINDGNKLDIDIKSEKQISEANNEEAVKTVDSYLEQQNLDQSQITNTEEGEELPHKEQNIANAEDTTDEKPGDSDIIGGSSDNVPTDHKDDGLGDSILAEVLESEENRENVVESEDHDLGLHDHPTESQYNEKNSTCHDEFKKGLIKVLGRSEVNDEHLKGVVKVEKINSEVLKDRSKVKEREKERRRTSSFEIVSPARSLIEDDMDSETPRSRSRTGAESSQLQDSGFEPSPRRDTKSKFHLFFLHQQ